MAACVYWPCSALVLPSKIAAPSKSFFLFILILVLQLVRERYEKSQAKRLEQVNGSGLASIDSMSVHLGRVAYLPIIYVCFSVLLLLRLPFFVFVLHTLFLASFASFYWSEIRQALGLDSQTRLTYSFLLDEVGLRPRISEDSLVYDFVRTCYENSDTRKIAIFFIINLSFMFVELIYGYLSNSLGLISDSFHMLFDCMALFIGLCASYIAKMQPNKHYTYGFGRVETLSGLFNGIFLVFIAFNVFCESIERIFEPQKIETEGLLIVSFMGLCVNLVGLFFFHEHHDHHHHEHGACDHHQHENENMYGVFLHVLADCLGSVGVIISSMLVKYYGLYVADPICSFIISLMILASSVPFIQMTASTLMLKPSASLVRRLGKARGKIDKLEGVVQCRGLSVWEITPKKAAVASVDLVVRDSCDHQVRSTIHDEISTILRSNKVKEMTVQMVSQQHAPAVPS